MTAALGQTAVLERHDGEVILACTGQPCRRTGIHVHTDGLEDGEYRAHHGDVLLLGAPFGALRLALGDRVSLP